MALGNGQLVFKQNIFLFSTAKYDNVLLQSVRAFLLQSATTCYYKVRQLFIIKCVISLLQSETGITKCDKFITKCDSTRVFKQVLILDFSCTTPEVCNVYFQNVIKHSCWIY